jgi:hypothetical protein
MKQSMTFFALAMALILIFMTGCGNEFVPQFAIDCMDQNNMDPEPDLALCLETCMVTGPLLDTDALVACYYSDCEVDYLTDLESKAGAVVGCIGAGIAQPVNQAELQMIYVETSMRLQAAFQDSYSTAFNNYTNLYGDSNNAVLEDAFVILLADLADKLFVGLEDGQGGMVFSGLQTLFSADPFGLAAGTLLFPLAPESP